MRNPLIHSIMIIICCVVVGFVAVFFLRYTGLSRQYSPIVPDWLTKKSSIYSGGLFSNYRRNTRKALIAGIKNKAIINMISLQRTRDGQFVIFDEEVLETSTNGEGPIFFHSLEELKKLHYKNHPDEKIVSFNEYISFFNDRPFIINMHEVDPAKMHGLSDIIREHQLEKKIILYSEYSPTLKYLRRELPRVSLAINNQNLMKMRFLQSLYIEPIVSLNGDIAIASIYLYKDRLLFTDPILTELRRRNIPVILKLNSTQLDHPQLKQIKPYAILYTP